MDDDLISVSMAEPALGIQIGNGVLRTHGPKVCKGQVCCIHNPSDHPLKNRPQNWRGDRDMMERICIHGVGHPDPDDLDFKRRSMGEKKYASGAYGVHGCDGCCA